MTFLIFEPTFLLLGSAYGLLWENGKKAKESEERLTNLPDVRGTSQYERKKEGQNKNEHHSSSMSAWRLRFRALFSASSFRYASHFATHWGPSLAKRCAYGPAAIWSSTARTAACASQFPGSRLFHSSRVMAALPSYRKRS